MMIKSATEFRNKGPEPIRTLPFNFGQKPINRLEEYSRGRHFKRYIAHCAQQCRLKPHELKTVCGYENYNKFLRRREQWNKCLRPIPLTYLDAIGAEIELMADVMRVDQAEFDEAIRLPRFPECFAIKYIPGLYLQRKLPLNVSEEEAVLICREYLSNHQHQSCLIVWPGLTSIIIRHGKETVQVYYRPELNIIGGFVSLGNDGSFVGTTRIG